MRRLRRRERGMVTAELAVAILSALALLSLLCWGIFLMVMQLRLVDTAAGVARQEARGDDAGVRVVRAAAPEGARVEVRRTAGQVRVVARLTVEPFGGGVVAVPLQAESVVVLEPGAR